MNELKQKPIWLMWRYEENAQGKKTKTPYSARTLNRCGANEEYRQDLTPYEVTVKTSKEKGYDGIGFVIPVGYAVIDLDHLEESFEKEVCSLVHSYTEVSPSGEGRHIIMKAAADRIPQEKGKLDPRYYVKNPHNNAELYIGGLTNRYMTFTGDAVVDMPIMDCTDGILTFLQKHMRKEIYQKPVEVKMKPAPAAPQKPAAKESPEDALLDMDILDIARNAKNGEKFKKLYDRGDSSDYGSQSEADLALCNMLAFYSQGNAGMIDRLYRESGLCRDKWNRDDYREATIEKAIAQCKGTFYVPKGKKPPFVYEDEKGRRHVNCPLLARYFREHQYMLSVRDSGRGSVQRYVYVDGCYRPFADEMIKGVIKSYVAEYDESLIHMRDINEVFQMLITDLHFAGSEMINADENLINFTNGLLDINSMTLLPHDPRILSTIQLPSEWTGKEIKTPVFDSFIGRLTGWDEDVQKLLLEFMGVCISNVKGWRMKKSLFMVGPGDTGKSQLKSLTERLLGKGNYVAIDLSEIEARFGTGNIYGKRLAGSSDMSFMTVSELKTFKKCTGGDSLFAEFKGQNGFEFVYNGLLWFCMNRLPRFGGDDGEWVYNRIMQVECNNVIPPEKQDKHLLDKLYEERAGILYKVVMALRSVIENGYKFHEPASMKESRKKYHDENNTVIAFFQECMEARLPGPIRDDCTTSRVYKVYRAWCGDNNHGFSKTMKEFRDELSQHLGVEYKKLVIRSGDRGSLFKAYKLTDEAKETYRSAYGFDRVDDFFANEPA